MVINLPLLATISCNKSSTSSEKPTLTNKKGTLSLTGLFDSNTDVNTAKQLINSKWIFDNKYKLFENPELLTSYDSITDIKVFESGTTIVLSFQVDSQEFEFVILGFLNPNYEQARLTIKNNTVFDRKLFTGIDNIEDINEAIKSINEQWLKTHKSIIFNNDHLITDKTSITVKADVSGTIIAVQAIISSEIYNFFISGFTNSIISGNNKETIVKSPLITNDSFSQKWAHLESYSNDQVKAFIESNKNTIFHNLHNETTIVSIDYTYRIVDGTIEAKVKLGGKVYDREGKLVNADSNKEYQVSLIGFKTIGLTTTLKVKEFSVKDIEGLKDKKASEIKKENNNDDLSKIKIKDLIQDSFLAQEIQDNDIEITIKEETVNDALGTLDVKVKVKNNKTWEYGIKKETKDFDLKLTGFKIQPPTEISNFEIKNLIDAKIKDKYAIPYGKWETSQVSTQEDKSDEQTNEEFLKQELNKYVSSFFNNEPSDAKIKEVKINKDYSIGSIQNGYDAAHGAVYVVVTLDKYYDENGKLITATSSQAKDDNKGKFYFKITGFKVDEKMTTHLDYQKLYDDPEWNSINLEPEEVKQEKSNFKPSEMLASNYKVKVFQDIFEKIILKHLTLKKEENVKNSESPKYTLDNIKNKVYGDDNWSSKNEINPSKDSTNNSDEKLIEKIKEHIYIDWENNNIIADDTKGTLTLEVTFKNIWWQNGVLINQHKETLRFSGFRQLWNKPTYNPNLLVIDQEVKQEDKTTTKEKVAIIYHDKFENIDFIDYLIFTHYQENWAEIDKILESDYGYSKSYEREGIIFDKLEGELDIDNEAIYKIVSDVFAASIKHSLQTEGDLLGDLAAKKLIVGIKNYDNVKVSASWNKGVGDTFDFSLQLNQEKFNFRLLGFLGANNLGLESEGSEEVNKNNDTSKKDWFDFKWVGHPYLDSEAIKNPKFYGHYWYSLEITIKKQTINTTSDILNPKHKDTMEAIKDNTLGDYYLNLGHHLSAYEIVKNDSNVTIKFRHEEWTSLNPFGESKLLTSSNVEGPEVISPYLVIKNLGSFNLETIYEDEINKTPNVEIRKSIFAAEFVKDNYDQYGAIKIKGYDLPTDFDQYEFWYKEKDGQFKKINKPKASITQVYYSDSLGKNVFVKIQFSFEALKEFPKDAKLYVGLKDDTENYHLINLNL